MPRVYSARPHVIFNDEETVRMSKTYRLGPQTIESVEILAYELGYNVDELRLLSEDDRFDFAISVIPEVKAWFADRMEIVEAPLIARAFIHALGSEV